ncbi:hypothetical protein EW146_g7182 [Bondarzewia mesenterica]|uniref:UDP-glucose/GDP-mannose dehydrogenase C-terminal domain-containing protein n=1 Tax=Bondarzewia mesenterica TaxID=1095465 RepID=A0A4S4LM29_9AGAM|nr:hypothetical protein EW146_g7182 [Bondarzewia mesenterica]
MTQPSTYQDSAVGGLSKGVDLSSWSPPLPQSPFFNCLHYWSPLIFGTYRRLLQGNSTACQVNGINPTDDATPEVSPSAVMAPIESTEPEVSYIPEPKAEEQEEDGLRARKKKAMKVKTPRLVHWIYGRNTDQVATALLAQHLLQQGHAVTTAPQQPGPSSTTGTGYTPRESGAPALGVERVLPKVEEGPNPSTLPPVTAPPSQSSINPLFPGMFDGCSILEVDLASLAEKPWRRPRSDISDWFNFGFDEISWEAYCFRRREVGELASVLKTNVLNFSGMPEDQLAQLPPEIHTMVMAGANAMTAAGGGGQMMGGMNGMTGPGVGDVNMQGMMGPMLVPTGGDMGMDGTGAQGQTAQQEQGMGEGSPQQGPPGGMGMNGMNMGADYAMQDPNAMQQQMYQPMETPTPPAPVSVTSGPCGGRRGPAVVRIRHASLPNVLTGSRNQNKCKHRDNTMQAVDELDYGGGQYRGGSTPLGDLMIEAVGSVLRLYLCFDHCPLITSISRCHAENVGIARPEMIGGSSNDADNRSEFLRASVGFGRSCFQMDILKLVHYQKRWFSKTVVDTLFNTITGKVNPVHSDLPKSIAIASRCLALAFKADTGDTRESPTISLIREFLSGEGASRSAAHKSKPRRSGWMLPRPFPTSPLKRGQVTLAPPALDASKNSEAVVVVTKWKEFREIEWEAVYNTMNKPAFVFDGRMRNMAMTERQAAIVRMTLAWPSPSRRLFYALRTVASSRRDPYSPSDPPGGSPIAIPPLRLFLSAEEHNPWNLLAHAQSIIFVPLSSMRIGYMQISSPIFPSRIASVCNKHCMTQQWNIMPDIQNMCVENAQTCTIHVFGHLGAVACWLCGHRATASTPEGWTVRYEHKMACFAEFRGKDEVVLKYYRDSYSMLVNMFDSTAILPPRTKCWSDAKVLADCINIKICKLFLYNNEHALAPSRHNTHMRKFGDSSRGWEIGDIGAGLRDRDPVHADPPSTPARSGVDGSSTGSVAHRVEFATRDHGGC